MAEKDKTLYGLLGYPVKHSLSPVMHNAGFKALNIKAEYRLFSCEPQALEDFFLSLKQTKIKGFNITVPYKEKVLGFMSDLSPEAEFTGAVNVVRIDSGRLKGFNTDGIGFYKHLTGELGFQIENKRVVILGAGGAAKAVAEQLAKHNSRFIQVYDIDSDKAKSLTQKINKEYAPGLGKKAECVYDIGELEIEAADLLINATPIGLKPGDRIIVDPQKLHRDLLVYDLIYNPVKTNLLKAALEKGAKTANGLGMLFYQGVRSFEIWLGLPEGKAPQSVMRQALIEAMGNNFRIQE
jgi:shikimate dehydrogenase